MSSYCSPGPPPVPFSTARLILSAGMFAALADSIASCGRVLPLGSPPPCLPATVISRRILEKSFPLCTSALPFLRLICDHRECPDMLSPSFLNGRFEPLDPVEPPRPALFRLDPAPLLARRLRDEARARPGPELRPQVPERQVCRAGVAHLARPGHLGENLDADLERRAAHVVQGRLERDDLVRRDGRVEVQSVHARGHDV